MYVCVYVCMCMHLECIMYILRKYVCMHDCMYEIFMYVSIYVCM